MTLFDCEVSHTTGYVNMDAQMETFERHVGR